MSTVVPFPERGVIRSREHASQIRVYRDLRWGTITPTDLDGVIDFDNRLFVFFEAKYGDATVKKGQRWAFERICDACERGNVVSIFFICQHQAKPGQDIDMANALVTSYRFKAQWHVPQRPPLRLLDAINQMREKYLKP